MNDFSDTNIQSRIRNVKRRERLSFPKFPTWSLPSSAQLTSVSCIMTYVLLSIGAIAGAITRYQLDAWSKAWLVTGFPWSTFLINVTGSFLIGLLANLLPERGDLRVFLMVGFCGSYTTFSTYSLEIVRQIQSGLTGSAILYLLASAIVAPLACFIGYLITSR